MGKTYYLSRDYTSIKSVGNNFKDLHHYHVCDCSFVNNILYRSCRYVYDVSIPNCTCLTSMVDDDDDDDDVKNLGSHHKFSLKNHFFNALTCHLILFIKTLHRIS
jgi:hypothetical protein